MAEMEIKTTTGTPEHGDVPGVLPTTTPPPRTGTSATPGWAQRPRCASTFDFLADPKAFGLDIPERRDDGVPSLEVDVEELERQAIHDYKNAIHQTDRLQGDLLRSARKAGASLNRLKDLNVIDAWEEWVLNHCDKSLRRAQEYMYLDRHWHLVQAELDRGAEASALFSVAAALKVIREGLNPPKEKVPTAPNSKSKWTLKLESAKELEDFKTQVGEIQQALGLKSLPETVVAVVAQAYVRHVTGKGSEEPRE